MFSYLIGGFPKTAIFVLAKQLGVHSLGKSRVGYVVGAVGVGDR